jgi:putative endonuclease
MHTRGKGKQGEDLAAEHLLASGFTLIARNYQTRHGEIDCVARDPDGILVFVEVKVCSGGRYGHPLFKVNRAKQRQLVAMARHYCAQHRVSGPRRFDVIAIQGGRLTHLKNAFLC